MAGLPPKLAQLLELFGLLSDRGERIDLLIQTADRFREVPAEVARRPFSDEHKVPACESEAYLWALRQPEGTLQLHFAVENPQGISAKAMAVILSETCSGAPLEQVAELPQEIVLQIFGNELSMGKSMGLMEMVAMVRITARRVLGGRVG